jgi:hypothetical protein
MAALSKLNGLIAMTAALRSTRRGALLGLGLASLLAVPFFFGRQAAFGLSQYATRWRSGDGLFSLILLASEAIVGGDWKSFDDGLTITKHGVARAITALIGIASAFVVLRRPAPVEAIPKRAGLLLLLLLLIAPTLHPWYVVWVLPFAVVEGMLLPILTLAFLAPLLHHPNWLALESGEWTDLGWVRALVHIPVWSALLYAAASCRSKKAC